MKLKELLQKIAKRRGEDHPFPDDIEAFLEDFVPNDLLKNDTLQLTFGISNYEMEQLYRDAYTFYQAKRFEDAAFSFRFLVLFDPYIKKYWMGLASCQLLKDDCEKALKSYAIASLLDNLDPYPHYYAYECYQKIGNGIESYKALECAYTRSLQNPVFKSLKMKIQSIKMVTG